MAYTKQNFVDGQTLKAEHLNKIEDGIAAAEANAVPTSRTVNGKALNSNITLSASDVGALPNTTVIPDALSDLKADSTHRTVTDTEKSTWNAKANTSDIPTKVSQLTNDKNYLTSYTETDPTVPSWAKASTKPSYTKSEVGLGNVDNVKQYSASNPPPYPVTKVNNKTGAITLSASDVGADATGTASSAVSAHNTNTSAHADIREQISQLSSEKVDVSKPIDPNWDKWNDIRYSYGFDKNKQPKYNTINGTLESDTMISIRGGKGRWGWHVFEGWSPEEKSRLTALIGKHHETFGYIQTFSPNGLYEARNRWGWVKLGCDELNEGTDFSKNWTTCYTPITLAPQSAPSSVADYDLNPQLTSNTVPVGTMYFDEEEQRIKIYTKTGWQPIAFVGEGGDSGGGSGEEEFYEPIVAYRNQQYVSVETGKITSPNSSVGRIAYFRLNKNTKYTVTRSALSSRFRVYLYYNSELDTAQSQGEAGILIAEDKNNTNLSTLTFDNLDYKMAVVMLSNKANETGVTITAEIVE